METSTLIAWPLEEKLINGFILWNAKEGGLSPSTIKSYIFSLSSIQKEKGLQPIRLKNTLGKILLKGYYNCYPVKKKERGAITLKLLSSLKGKNFSANWPIVKKRRMWLACSLAFFGCLRIGEVLRLKWGDFKIHKKGFQQK